MFWEGFAKELTAEPKWAKYSKRWSSSGQVPPLVPIAKVKLNLLSAPLKQVSWDSELSLSHPSPQQGPKGDPLKEWGSEQFAFTFKPSRPNNPIVTLSISLYHNCHPNAMQNATDWQLQWEEKKERKREEISKVKPLITIFQRGFRICSKAHVKKHAPVCFSAQHQTPISTLFMNMPAIVLGTPDCSINPAEVCDILYTEVDLRFLWMSEKSNTHCRSTACEHSPWVKMSCCVSGFSDKLVRRNQAVSCTINLKEVKQYRYQNKTGNITSGFVSLGTTRGNQTTDINLGQRQTD